MSIITREELVGGLVREIKEDYVGLWQVVAGLAGDVGVLDPGERRRDAMLVVAKLLEHGLRPGALTTKDGFIYWPETGSKEILARIEREWDALGHEPHLLDSICWFNEAPK